MTLTRNILILAAAFTMFGIEAHPQEYVVPPVQPPAHGPGTLCPRGMRTVKRLQGSLVADTPNGDVFVRTTTFTDVCRPDSIPSLAPQAGVFKMTMSVQAALASPVNLSCTVAPINATTKLPDVTSCPRAVWSMCAPQGKYPQFWGSANYPQPSALRVTDASWGTTFCSDAGDGLGCVTYRAMCYTTVPAWALAQ